MGFTEIINSISILNDLDKSGKVDDEFIERKKLSFEIQQKSVDNLTKKVDESYLKLEKALKLKKWMYATSFIAAFAVMTLFVFAFIKDRFPDIVFYVALTLDSIIAIMSFIAFVRLITIIQCTFNSYKELHDSLKDATDILVIDYVILLICGYKHDLKMYKDLYKVTYDVQEFLREHDKKGFEAFINAFDGIGVDLHSIISRESVEPSINVSKAR